MLDMYRKRQDISVVVHCSAGCEWVDKWVSAQWVTQWVSGWCEWVSGWVSGWMSEWVIPVGDYKLTLRVSFFVICCEWARMHCHSYPLSSFCYQFSNNEVIWNILFVFLEKKNHTHTHTHSHTHTLTPTLTHTHTHTHSHTYIHTYIHTYTHKHTHTHTHRLFSYCTAPSTHTKAFRDMMMVFSRSCVNMSLKPEASDCHSNKSAASACSSELCVCWLWWDRDEVFVPPHRDMMVMWLT